MFLLNAYHQLVHDQPETISLSQVLEKIIHSFQLLFVFWLPPLFSASSELTPECNNRWSAALLLFRRWQELLIRIRRLLLLLLLLLLHNGSVLVMTSSIKKQIKRQASSFSVRWKGTDVRRDQLLSLFQIISKLSLFEVPLSHSLALTCIL